MAINIHLRPQDGIGPRSSAATPGVLRITGVKLGLGWECKQLDIGLNALPEHQTILPNEIVLRAQPVDGAISHDRASKPEARHS